MHGDEATGTEWVGAGIMMGRDVNAGEAVRADVSANGVRAATAKAAVPEGGEVGVMGIVEVYGMRDVE